MKKSESKLKEFPSEEQGDDQSKIEEIKLTKQSIEKMSWFLGTFDETFLKKCFCNNWKLKKETTETLIKVLSNYDSLKTPNYFIVSRDKVEFYEKCWELSFHFLEDIVP